jgi:hypothetical protein
LFVAVRVVKTSAGEQLLCKALTEKSGAAGDKNFHAVFLFY